MKSSRSKIQEPLINDKDIKIVKRGGKKLYKCPFCVGCFVSKNGVYEHIRLHHSTKMRSYDCAFCPSNFTSEFSKTRHENKMHLNKTPAPSTIGPNQMVTRNLTKTVSARNTRYEKRISNTTDASLIIPPFIDTPKRKTRLNTESSTKHTTDTSPPVASTSNQTGQTHLDAKKKKTEIVYASKWSCSYCNKFCTSAQGKAKHEKIHTGIRNFVCKFCSSAFFYKSALISHEEKCKSLCNAVWCKFCDFSTFLSSNLEGHYRRVHDFKFKSKSEMDFIKQEMDTFQVNGTESSSVEDEITQTKHNLEELFRDYIILPNSESSEGASGSKSEIEVSESSEKVEKMDQGDGLEPTNSINTLNNDATTLYNVQMNGFLINEPQFELETSSSRNLEEILRDHNYIFIPNPEPVENVVLLELQGASIEAPEDAESSEYKMEIPPSSDVEEKTQNPLEPVEDTVPLEDACIEVSQNPESSEYKIDIPQTTNEIREIDPIGDSEPNSNLTEDTDVSSPKNTPIESENRILQADKPEIIIQDDILEPNSEQFEDNILREDTTNEIPSEQLDDTTRENFEKSPDNDPEPVSECQENSTSQNDPVFNTLEENSQLNSDTQDIDVSRQSSENPRENNPEQSDSNLESEMEISPSETTTDPASETNTDSATETNTDSAPEMNIDSASETNNDSAPETNTDPASETNTDSATETNTDSAPEMNTDQASEINTDSASEMNTDSATETNTDSAPETNTDSALETNTDPPSETNADSATENNTDSVPQTNTVPASEMNTNSAPEMNTDSASETNTDSAPETNTASALEMNIDSAPETNTNPVEPAQRIENVDTFVEKSSDGDFPPQSAEKSNENIPELSDLNLDPDRGISAPETNADPVDSSQTVEIVDGEEESSEKDSETTRLENDLREIFGDNEDANDTSEKTSNKTDQNKSYRTIDLTGDDIRVVRNIDLTLSDDESDPKTIVIDDDDD